MKASDLVIGKNYIDRDFPGSPVKYVGICEGIFAGEYEFEGVDADIKHSGMICDDGDLEKYVGEIDNKLDNKGE